MTLMLTGVVRGSTLTPPDYRLLVEALYERPAAADAP